MKKYISTSIAAKSLGVNPQRVRALIQSGQLPADLVGKTWILRPENLTPLRGYLGNGKGGRPPLPWRTWPDGCGIGESAAGTLLRTGDRLRFFEGLSAWQSLVLLYEQTGRTVDDLRADTMPDGDFNDFPHWHEMLAYALRR